MNFEYFYDLNVQVATTYPGRQVFGRRDFYETGLPIWAFGKTVVILAPVGEPGPDGLRRFYVIVWLSGSASPF